MNKKIYLFAFIQSAIYIALGILLGVTSSTALHIIVGIILTIDGICTLAVSANSYGNSFDDEDYINN